MCIKDVQKLTGCMAAQNRFISKLGERGLSFFKLLKHQEKFMWTPEVDQALTQLKDFLSKPPVLTSPRKGEQILLDLAAETTRISANGIPNLSTSVVVPGGLPRAIPVSAIPKSIQKGKNNEIEYNIYFITIIRVHLFGTCRVQVHQD
jgi:hypothetical protein